MLSSANYYLWGLGMLNCHFTEYESYDSLGCRASFCSSLAQVIHMTNYLSWTGRYAKSPLFVIQKSKAII